MAIAGSTSGEGMFFSGFANRGCENGLRDPRLSEAVGRVSRVQAVFASSGVSTPRKGMPSPDGEATPASEVSSTASVSSSQVHATGRPAARSLAASCAAKGSSRPRRPSSSPWVKTSAGVPSSAMRPWSITITRSAGSASSMKWVMCTMVEPAACRRSITCRIERRPRTSSRAPGSSKTIASGSIARAPAMATRCFWPPESLVGSAAA